MGNIRENESPIGNHQPSASDAANQKQTNKTLLGAHYSTIPINFMVVNTNGNIDVNAGEKPVVYTAGTHYRPTHGRHSPLLPRCHYK